MEPSNFRPPISNLQIIVKRTTYAIVVGALALAGCHKKAPAPPAPKPEKPHPKVSVGSELQGVKLLMNDAKGRPVYRIETKKTEASSATEKATLSDTTVTLYHEGNPDMIVTAPKTSVNARTKDLIMTGGVTAKSPAQHQTFHVDRLTWNAATKKYVGEGHVRYSRPPLEMTAQRISGKTPVSVVKMDGGVQLNVRPQ